MEMIIIRVSTTGSNDTIVIAAYDRVQFFVKKNVSGDFCLLGYSKGSKSSYFLVGKKYTTGIFIY